jgi:hypothetical protein
VQGFRGATPRALPFADARPFTTVQLVLADRRRVRERVNLDSTVLDLYRHVQHLSGVATPFELLAGFPPKALADPSATIEAAGLAGSSVQQRV